MIISESQRCKVIVANLLNFARQHDVAVEPVDINQLLQDLVSRVHIEARFEQVEFCFNLDPKLPNIQADPAQLQQVFINLLNNSADAIAGPGTITITTRSLGGHSVEILVADTGPGIPPEALGKLFTPFFTTKPAGKGTGLGLAIVYGIVKMHRGQIRVESHPGHGATMTVELPVRSSDHPVHHSASTGEIIS
jgi:two-component system, NtrC family, sensor kinase